MTYIKMDWSKGMLLWICVIVTLISNVANKPTNGNPESSGIKSNNGVELVTQTTEAQTGHDSSRRPTEDIEKSAIQSGDSPSETSVTTPDSDVHSATQLHDVHLLDISPTTTETSRSSSALGIVKSSDSSSKSNGTNSDHPARFTPNDVLPYSSDSEVTVKNTTSTDSRSKTSKTVPRSGRINPTIKLHYRPGGSETTTSSSSPESTTESSDTISSDTISSDSLYTTETSSSSDYDTYYSSDYYPPPPPPPAPHHHHHHYPPPGTRFPESYFARRPQYPSYIPRFPPRRPQYPSPDRPVPQPRIQNGPAPPEPSRPVFISFVIA